MRRPALAIAMCALQLCRSAPPFYWPWLRSFAPSLQGPSSKANLESVGCLHSSKSPGTLLVESTTEVRTVLVEARSPAQPRRLFSTIKSQGSTDTVDLFTGHTAFRLSLCLTLALCSTIRLETQRSSANSVASCLLRWILDSSRPAYLSVARRSKFFKMEENSWS